MIFILGIDCALKTLGYSLICIREELIADCLQLCKNRDVDIAQLELLVSEIMTVKSYGVIDVLDGNTIRSISPIDRIIRLKEWLVSSPIALRNLRKMIGDATLYVSIEDQPHKIGRFGGGATTHNSADVAAQLAFYYSCEPQVRVFFTSPAKKKQFYFDETTKYEHFLQAETARGTKDATYAANKKHATACFEYLRKYIKCEGAPLKKSLINHAADATLMALLGMRNY